MPLPCLTRMVLPLRSECSSRRRGGARVVCACVRADKCEAPAARNERLWLGITSSDRRAWMQTNYCSSSKRESSSGRARTSRSTLVPGLTSIQILVHGGLYLGLQVAQDCKRRAAQRAWHGRSLCSYRPWVACNDKPFDTAWCAVSAFSIFSMRNCYHNTRSSRATTANPPAGGERCDVPHAWPIPSRVVRRCRTARAAHERRLGAL